MVVINLRDIQDMNGDDDNQELNLSGKKKKRSKKKRSKLAL